MTKGQPKEKTTRQNCRCFGTRHEFLTGCINCGYIVCKADEDVQASLVCPFCDAALLMPMTATQAENIGETDSGVRAYKLKDKLMQFDKENAKRTKVRDAQADYYEATAWLSKEEEEKAKAKDARRREKNNKRSNKVNITFDVAGRKRVEIVKSSGESGEGSDQSDEEEWVDEEEDGEIGLSNVELEAHRGRAGEVYRHMKASWGKNPPKISS